MEFDSPALLQMKAKLNEERRGWRLIHIAFSKTHCHFILEKTDAPNIRFQQSHAYFAWLDELTENSHKPTVLTSNQSLTVVSNTRDCLCFTSEGLFGSSFYKRLVSLKVAGDIKNCTFDPYKLYILVSKGCFTDFEKLCYRSDYSNWKIIWTGSRTVSKADRG